MLQHISPFLCVLYYGIVYKVDNEEENNETINAIVSHDTSTNHIATAEI